MATVVEQAATLLTGPLPGSLNLVNVDASVANTLALRLQAGNVLRQGGKAATSDYEALVAVVASALHQSYCTSSQIHTPTEADVRLARAVLPIVKDAVCNITP